MINDGKIIVSLFSPKTTRETVLTTNGRILDRYCTSLKGEQDISGNFRLTGNFLNKDYLFKYLTEGCIVKVRNEFGEDEVFRITTVNPSPFLISIISFQITITDTQSLWLDDVRPTNQNGLSALQWLYENADSMGFPKEIIMHSDIDTVNTAYYQNMNLHNALFNCDQSFINRWGGEVERHQYNLTINKQIGEDNNVTIRENKNLTGFEATISTDDLCTVGIGVGFNGIKGHYIESPLKDKYPVAYTKVIEYSDVKVRTDSDDTKDDDTMLFDSLEEAQKELDRRIRKEFSENHIDEIKATYNIDFVALSKTEKFKDYVKAERLHIGDYVNAIVNSLDIRIKVRVFTKEVDYLVGRVNKMTLSNVSTASLDASDSKIVANIRKLLKRNNTLDLEQYVDSTIKSGMKNSHVLVRKNEVLIMDSNDVDEAEAIWRWNKNGLGFSSTGYDGKYEIGLTSDGVLNANIIRTGVLSTVLIQNADGSFKIDLSGCGGAKYYNNGQLSMEMANNSLKLFNWLGNAEKIGALTAICHNDENGNPVATKPMIGLVNEKNSALSIGYKDKDKNNIIHSYIDFDYYNILGDSDTAPIRIRENIEARGINIYNATYKSDKAFPVFIDNVNVSNFNKDKIYFNVPVAPTKGLQMNDQPIKNSKMVADKVIPFYIGDKLVGKFLGDRLVLNVPIYGKNGIAMDPNAEQGIGVTVDDADPIRQKVIEYARTLIGKPYIFGGNYPTDNGTDCSGLAVYSYSKVNISLPRTTYDQIKQGTEVSESDLKIGDLVFSEFSSPNVPEHVFIYSGEKDGKHMCVEAPHTGLNIRERSFTWTSGMRARRIIKDKIHPVTPSGQGGDLNGAAKDYASPNMIYFCKNMEGFASEPYNDGTGTMTIGLIYSSYVLKEA